MMPDTSLPRLAGTWIPIVLLALAATLPAHQSLRALVPDPFTARVVSVIDGDTLDVVRPGKPDRLRIRLEGIDAAEPGEPFSQVARNRARVLAFDKDVRIEGRDIDRYSRLVARVIVDEDGRPTDLSVALVTEGLACHYTVFSSDPVLARAEAAARSAGRGFWARDAQKPRCALNATGERAPTARPGAAFFGNVRSRVYHAPTCRNAGCPNCTRRFASRAEADAAGFRPAGDCLR